ncbi:MAG: hypothetical protein H6842_06885 [Rhodospirillaceae bacterium]|nr:hypothetical protein [Rhodospirillaceae bacterium]
MQSEIQRESMLRRGLIDETGARHRRVLLRPLTGWQEATLGTSAGGVDPWDADAVLAACIERLGGYRDVVPDHVEALSVGDRARLALTLSAMMFGDRLWLTVACPNPACGEPADLQVSLAEVLDHADEAEPEWLEVATPDGPARFRPPTGADERAAAGDDAPGPADMRDAALWCRIVARVGHRGPLTREDWLALAPASRQAIALALADAGSAPELFFASHCPACAAWIELDLDPIDLLVRQFRLGADRLLAEVHSLAFHYGWSEDQILNLPRSRRWRYIELLRNQLEGRSLLGPWS